MGSCSGITGSGSRCRAIAITGSDYCHAHHPDRAEARKKAARHGGKSGGRGRPQVELTEIKDRLKSLIDDVRNGNMNRADAIACNQLYSTLIRPLSVELRAREVEEIAREVEEIRDALEMRKEQRQRWG
jgi:hypothetical protein